MKKCVVLAFMALALVASSATAQTMAPMVYSLPNTDGSAQWIALGTYNATQNGYDISVQIVSSDGYNATIIQDQITYIQFKSSNGVQVNANGFAGDSWWYQTGPNVNAPSQVVWVANAAGGAATAFTLYVYMGNWSGYGSYYVVDIPPGISWTNSAAGGQSNPGTNSSTVLIAQNEYFIGSTASFAGNVGIGTSSPLTPLHVKETTNQDILFSPNGNAGFNGAAGVAAVNDANNSYVPLGFEASQYFFGTGNVGIGTTAPAYNLDVAGSIHSTGSVIASGGITFPDGSTQSTAFNPTLCGGDFAESVSVSGDRTMYEPGDVLVIDTSGNGKFLKSAEPYSTSVLGVYSTKPGMVGRRQTTPKGTDEVPMAMVGIVPVKVIAENGPIKPGDLLVTASTLGYAMKGTDRSRMLGAVIGKALGSLEGGAGVIEVGIALQ